MKASFLLLCLFLISITNGQKIKIGDKIPDWTYSNLINYQYSNLALSDFKDKLIILDFWNHHCISCIKAFPKIDSLQKKFKDRIQIILINKESRDSTLKFFSKRKKIKAPDVPLITGDSILANLFPINGYPYNVWVDGQGIVKHITGGYNTTEQHIEKFLNGDNIALRNTSLVKKSFEVNLSNSIPPSFYLYYSLITRCDFNVDIGHTEGVYVDDLRFRMSSNCSSIIELYKKAYREYDKFNFDLPYSIQINVSDSIKYFEPMDVNRIDSWSMENKYNYELILPPSESASRYKIMQDDLDRIFNLDARIEYKTIKGLVLERTSKLDKLKSEGGESILKFIKSDNIYDSTLFCINTSFDDVFRWLKIWVENYKPIQDNTNYTGMVDMLIRRESVYPFNLEKLNFDFNKYDLELKEKDVVIPILIIKEKK